MFEKRKLIDEIANFLYEKGFSIFRTKGCIDVIARKKETYILKFLLNIDGFLEFHASSMKSLSYYLVAFPFVIAQSTNHGKLEDGVIYSRFEIPVVTPTTFKRIVEKKEVKRFSSKGKKLVEIDTSVLRKRRVELNYTLECLAKKVGISKKALYEIENKRVNPQDKTAKKLEEVLKVKLIKKYIPHIQSKSYVPPKNRFQMWVISKLKKIGIDSSVVYVNVFNIVGKKSEVLVSSVERKPSNKTLECLRELSEKLNCRAFAISEKKLDTSVPLLSSKDLSRINSFEELLEAIS